ncbi:hypothetical protein CR513_45828, partial [Mucuna pruriens]
MKIIGEVHKGNSNSYQGIIFIGDNMLIFAQQFEIFIQLLIKLKIMVNSTISNYDYSFNFLLHLR